MATGSPRSYFKKFKFVVQIDGFSYFGFSACTELSAEVGVIGHREGGAMVEDKSPGLLTIPNLTLSRGATQDEEMFIWFKQVVDMNSGLGEGQIEPNFMRNLDIVQQDRDGTELRRWRVKAAWPRKFVAGEWDNNAEENVIHSLELVIRTFA